MDDIFLGGEDPIMDEGEAMIDSDNYIKYLIEVGHVEWLQ